MRTRPPRDLRLGAEHREVRLRRGGLLDAQEADLRAESSDGARVFGGSSWLEVFEGFSGVWLF